MRHDFVRETLTATTCISVECWKLTVGLWELHLWQNISESVAFFLWGHNKSLRTEKNKPKRNQDMRVTKLIYVYLQQTINNGYYCETYEVKPLCFILNLKQSDLCVNNLSYLKSPFWVLALFSRGFELLLDLISLNETKTAPRLQSHGTLFFFFYLVSPTKYELWLDKRQLNVSFCACDISCNRKMGLSLKIYDMPYWTEALSTPHPSNQPPESVSNAHHSLMNMINPNVGSLWTPFKDPPLHKHHIPFANHQVSWHP